MNFARQYPQDVAGVVLLDSMHPEQYTRIPAWPGFYAMFRRASAVFPSLSRLGAGRLINASAYRDLPPRARSEERAFQSTPRDLRSTRDEFSEIRTAMSQANALTTLDDRLVPTANHSMLTESEEGAAPSSRAINDVVAAVRIHAALPAEER
jgi:pimeloyl-ACP methyl ester carboxylesterase